MLISDLNLPGWIVLKSNVSLSDDLNEPLTKNCAIKEKYYWERLVNTDDQRNVLFPSDYNCDRFKINVDISFHILEKNSNMIFLLQYII